MRQFTIAYDGEIIPNHVFRTMSMAQKYLNDCGYKKVQPTEWELSGIVFTSRAQILRIRSEKGLTKSNRQLVKE